MSKDNISTPENVNSLKKDLAKHYDSKAFLKCNNMGEILKQSLETVLDQKQVYQFPL